MNANPGPERLIAQMKSLHENINGFRIKSTLKSATGNLIAQFMPFKSFINLQSNSVGLRRNGEFYFNYPQTGFSGIVCFDASHVSIQTSIDRINLDFFISDRILNNINIAEDLYRETVKFFESEILLEEYLSV